MGLLGNHDLLKEQSPRIQPNLDSRSSNSHSAVMFHIIFDTAVWPLSVDAPAIFAPMGIPRISKHCIEHPACQSFASNQGLPLEWIVFPASARKY